MMNPAREAQIWWEVRDRDAWNFFEAWLANEKHETSLDPMTTHWSVCERCFRDRLFQAASDHLNPYIAFTARNPRYQWSFVDHEPFVRPLTITARR